MRPSTWELFSDAAAVDSLTRLSISPLNTCVDHIRLGWNQLLCRVVGALSVYNSIYSCLPRTGTAIAQVYQSHTI